MRVTLFKLLPLTAVAVCMLGLTAAPAPAADDDGFTPLFNGRDLTGFKIILNGKEAEPGKTFTVKEGVVMVSGNPAGYMQTDKSYKNYVLRFDWKFTRPDGLESEEKFGGNSGCLVHVQGLPAKGAWPKCVEVQGMNREHARIFAFGASGKFKFDAEALKKARKPVGEWNTTEIISKDGELTSKVNGAEIASGKGELMEGPIGWQSEGAEIYFRNLRIKEVK